MVQPTLSFELCTRANRETRLVRFTARCLTDDPLIEPIYSRLKSQFGGDEDPNLPLWEIALTYRTGMDIEETQIILMRTGEEREVIEREVSEIYSDQKFNLANRIALASFPTDNSRHIVSIDPDSMSGICDEIL